jgi:hypothetical protein
VEYYEGYPSTYSRACAKFPARRVRDQWQGPLAFSSLERPDGELFTIDVACFGDASTPHQALPRQSQATRRAGEFGAHSLRMRRALDWIMASPERPRPYVRAGLETTWMDAFGPFDGRWRRHTLECPIAVTDQTIAGLASG